MSQIDDVMDKLNGLDAWMQWSFGLALTLLTVAIVRFLMRKVLLDFVRKTSFEWDDKLYAPVTKRLYLFMFIAGILLTMTWVLGNDHSLVESSDPFFQAIFILLSTSLVSASFKVMIPVIMDRFSEPSSVTVSGSNSLIIFLARAADLVWWIIPCFL